MQRMLWQSVIWNLIFPWIRYAQCLVYPIRNFSTIFKKETGKSFITYLTDYRMDVAVRLIVETNDKSYEIGEKVGYLDANYFSYVFKKKFGVSPSKIQKITRIGIWIGMKSEKKTERKSTKKGI